MKTMISTLMLGIGLFCSDATAQLQKALVLNMQVDGVNTTVPAATTTLKIELDKTKKFAALDKTDVDINQDSLKKPLNDCNNIGCLIKAGELAGVDKIFTGSIVNLGTKIAITIKMIDIKTKSIEKVEVGEFIVLDAEVQNMIRITLNNMFEIPNDEQIVNSLVYYRNVEAVPTTKVNNNGPRFGVAFVGGSIADRLSAAEEVGGYEAGPLFSQIGYQFEGQYLSSGDLTALGEVLFMVTGLDQQMFIPSATIMNGFRLNKSGWEIAFGPSFKIQKRAHGYTDSTGTWHLSRDWMEASPNPYAQEYKLDSRGDVFLGTAWVWGIGKTFRSGYLNIPVNAYFSKSKDGWFTGLSFGFNIKSRKRS